MSAEIEGLSPQQVGWMDAARRGMGISWAEAEMLLEMAGEGLHEFEEPPCPDIQEFIESDRYCAMKDEVYPTCVDSLREMLSGRYDEAVLTGAIGVGKTTMAVWAQLYELHKLLCMVDPQGVYGQQHTDEIVIVFQSKTRALAYDVGYKRFRELADHAPWFRGRYDYNRDIRSEMQFKSRIIVKPVTGEESGALGQNVIGGVIDEMNFMATVEKSKLTGDGGEYNQAVSLYNAIARRRKNRFMQYGRDLPGMLSLVSSKRYRGQFTDQKQEEARTNPRIFVYDKKPWDVKPWAYGPETFPVFVGDETRKPLILDADSELPEEDWSLVEDVPTEHLPEFEADLLAALRDILGVSTTAIHPFIMEPEKVAACFGRVPSVFGTDWCDFVALKAKMFPKRITSPWEPRYAHVDLGLTGDSCGVAIGHVTGFTAIDRGPGGHEFLPLIKIDGILEVRPPKGGEIVFEKVRELFYRLRQLGMNIKWVTYDSWQSKDSLQILQGQGFVTGNLSLDGEAGKLNYDIAKRAFYDGRVQAPEHPLCLTELVTLECDEKKRKVDHKPHGSKDCADAIGGVISGLTRRREIWARHGVNPSDIPPSVKDPTNPNIEPPDPTKPSHDWDQRVKRAKQREKRAT